MVRAQLKIQQMAFMLLAVTLFFVFAGLFILVVKMAGINEDVTELREKNAMLLAVKVANSPEFSCGGAFDTSMLSCVDFDKVFALKEKSHLYEGFWGDGVTNIEIIKIYPVGDLECDDSSYPDCNRLKIYSGESEGFDYSNFVSLCRKEKDGGEIYDKCEIAKIVVRYEDV